VIKILTVLGKSHFKSVFIWIVILSCIPQTGAIGQALQAISGDGHILVTANYEGDSIETITHKGNYGVEIESDITVKYYLISINDLEEKKVLQKIRFHVKEKSHPDTLVVAPKGQNFYLKFRNHYLVFNTTSGRLIGSYFCPSNRALYLLSRHSNYNEDEVIRQNAIAFPGFDNQYVVRNESFLVYYDAFAGIPIDTCTGFSKNALFKQLYFSKDDNYLVAQDTRNRFYVWKTGVRKILLRIFADEVAFSPDLNILHTLRKSSNNFHLQSFTLQDMKAVLDIRKNDLQRFYPPPLKKGNKTIVYFPGKNTEQQTVALSTSGSYLLYSFDYDRLSDYYMFIRTDSLSVISHFDELKMGRKYRSCRWISDNQFEISGSGISSRIYTIPSTAPPLSINYRYNAEQVEPNTAVSIRKAEKNSYLSSLRTYKAYTLDGLSSQFTIIQSTIAPAHESVLINRFRCAGFTSDGKSVVLIGPKQIPVKLSIKELFEKNGFVPTRLLTDFDASGKTVTESWVARDSKPPSTYTYYRFDTLVPIYRVLPDEELHLMQKSISSTDTLVTMQVHLLDNSGRYYSRAAKDGTKDIWCGLFVQKPDSTIEKIEHFDVVEINDSEKQKDAIALVLDHSGSMGMQRSLDIEKSARDFIQLKNKKDAIALVKYDDWIGVESYLTSNTQILLDSLKMLGIKGYGGNTALLDAINTGVFLLKNEYGYNRKAVVLMTDGMENSSAVSQKEVLKRALENNISIYTIGFGNQVDSDYLKALSARTGGSYYQIYGSKDLRWIFSDIYKKINNYYEIRFGLTTVGIHKIILKICYENAKPLVTEYDNTPLPPLEKLDTAEYDISLPVKIQVFDSLVIEEPEFERINQDLPPIPFEKLKQNKLQEEDTLQILEEFNFVEFPNIRFEFDKTVVIPGTDNGIENVVGFLNKYPLVNIEIIGHTDSIGSIDYNIGLSIRRAKKVKQMLIDRGIAGQRIYISGMGESLPALANNNFWKRTYNRRVEFRLIFPKDRD
jgi:outer membrane protein OmpA-like peptidoglycan-associated protein/Mg-chelatase subunit ChlD